jgi:hypothetical protein
MRRSLSLLLPLALAGCAGNVADYVGPRSTIIADELARYGLGPAESQCIGAHLGTNLTPLQLRRFERLAAVVQQGFFDPDRLTVRDLMHVASTMSDPQIRLELARATDGCGVTAEPPAPEPAPATPATEAEPRVPAWLNLGAAPTGQAIAVDAATLEQETNFRNAWFRLTNPDETVPSDVAYLLRIDCAARTIEALAHRRQDAAGAITEHREYARDEEGPLPIEGGTVMEIAYLALCT